MTISRALRREMDHEVEMAGGLREGLCMLGQDGDSGTVPVSGRPRCSAVRKQSRDAAGVPAGLPPFVSMDAQDADPALLAIVQKAA
jgi:hypothetical protein